jgi:hypothetical protein
VRLPARHIHINWHRGRADAESENASTADAAFTEALDRVLASLEDLQHDEFQSVEVITREPDLAGEQLDVPPVRKPRGRYRYRRARRFFRGHPDVITLVLVMLVSLFVGWLVSRAT